MVRLGGLLGHAPLAIAFLRTERCSSGFDAVAHIFGVEIKIIQEGYLLSSHVRFAAAGVPGFPAERVSCLMRILRDVYPPWWMRVAPLVGLAGLCQQARPRQRTAYVATMSGAC